MNNRNFTMKWIRKIWKINWQLLLLLVSQIFISRSKLDHFWKWRATNTPLTRKFTTKGWGLRLSAFKVGATGQINRILKLIRSEWPEAHPSWPAPSLSLPPTPLYNPLSPTATGGYTISRWFYPMMESLRSSWGYDCQTLNLLPPPSPPLVRYWITLPPHLLELTSQVLTCGWLRVTS